MKSSLKTQGPTNNFGLLSYNSEALHGRRRGTQISGVHHFKSISPAVAVAFCLHPMRFRLHPMLAVSGAVPSEERHHKEGRAPCVGHVSDVCFAPTQAIHQPGINGPNHTVALRNTQHRFHHLSGTRFGKLGANIWTCRPTTTNLETHQYHKMQKTIEKKGIRFYAINLDATQKNQDRNGVRKKCKLHCMHFIFEGSDQGVGLG